MVEEKDHAQWLLEDLRSIGCDAREQSLCPLVPTLVGSVFYYIFYLSPAAILGYMYTLESNPPTMVDVQMLEQHLPPSLLRTMKYHAQHDPGHADKMKQQIERLSEYEVALVDQMAQITQNHLIQIAQGLSNASANHASARPAVPEPESSRRS